MSKNVRLGIIRARHDTTVSVIPDPACIAMLMTGDHALFRYWINTTRGHLDFLDSPMFAWVDITLGSDTSRGAQATAAINALRARYPGHDPLAGLAGLVVLTHPGTQTMANPLAGQPGQPRTVTTAFDGGATGVGRFTVAVLPTMASDHTFMCHEIGHVLGFDHTFGLDNNGTDWDPTDANVIVGPEYGSPYDLMSSASFGSRWLGTGPFYSASPTFFGPAVSGWPNTSAFSMGPHLARANLHRFMPAALAGRVVERPFPSAGGAVRVRLVPASAPAGQCLLILHPANEPANGVGRVYVEYRTARGWDAGMDILGPSTSREGVVVHSLVDQPNVGPRVWYRGSVLAVSHDSDVAVATTALVVGIEAIDRDRNWVDVAVTSGAARSIGIFRGNHSDDFVGVIGQLQPATTPCGDAIRKGTFATSTVSQFRIRTTGFGGAGAPGVPEAAVAWTVGGVAAPANNGTVDVPFEGATFAVQYTIDPVVFELTVTSRGGERFEAPVVVTIAGGGTTATASTTFAAQGWFDGVHPDDMATVARCIPRILDGFRYRSLPPVFRKPTPEPGWSLNVRKEAEQLWYSQVVRLINESPIDVDGQTAFRQLVDLQVHATQTLLGALAAAGIDFSVPEADISGWLQNREFTPYPALAEALLERLKGNSLRRPVFLDVIAFNYEHTPGVLTPRAVEQVRVGVLEAAVLQGSNTRYGERAVSFADLLVVDDDDHAVTRVHPDVAGEIWRMGRARHADPE